jgi:hypothetical protein
MRRALGAGIVMDNGNLRIAVTCILAPDSLFLGDSYHA